MSPSKPLPQQAGLVPRRRRGSPDSLDFAEGGTPGPGRHRATRALQTQGQAITEEVLHPGRPVTLIDAQHAKDPALTTDKDPTPILCVEDEATSFALLLHILKQRFSVVLTARNGAEGLEVFRRHRPPIVITDIYMPVMSGIDLARAIKVEAPGTQIIVITSDDEPAAILAAVGIGVVDYVLKPIVPARLGAVLDKCIQVAALERALRLSRTRMEDILESIGDAFFALEKDWRFTYLNQQAEEHFALPRAALLGKSFRELMPGSALDHPAFDEAMRTQEKRTFEQFTPQLGRWHDVSIFPLEGGISVYLRDITEKKKHADEIQALAFHDKLTGLPNRALLQDRLDHTIQWCKRSNERGAVLFLDLDRFKSINDSLGHEAGDQVLKEVASRLRNCLRDCDTVARLGGDEFIILLEGFDHPDNIHSVTHRLLLAMAEEILIQGLPLSVTCSIGISMIPTDGDTVDALLKASDMAMYHSKGLGRNAYHFYRPEMNIETRHFLQLENALRKSVKDHDFVLHYQAQVDLRSREILGFEALVRWNHPDLGLVQPDAFIPLAEETGLILLLGDWVLQTACNQARAWMDLPGHSFRMAVNLSARQFWQSDLVESITRALAKAGLPPDRLELEITESMVMRDVDLAIRKMRELTALGIQLSMDDFGTGYSSLAALKRFPIHTLKIDKSFVQDITTNPNDAAISTSIIALAHTMNLTVVAEGIETQAQLDFLLEKGCEIGQGFIFSRPIPALEAEQQLRGWLRAGQACPADLALGPAGPS